MSKRYKSARQIIEKFFFIKILNFLISFAGFSYIPLTFISLVTTLLPITPDFILSGKIVELDPIKTLSEILVW